MVRRRASSPARSRWRPDPGVVSSPSRSRAPCPSTESTEARTAARAGRSSADRPGRAPSAASPRIPAIPIVSSRRRARCSFPGSSRAYSARMTGGRAGNRGARRAAESSSTRPIRRFFTSSPAGHRSIEASMAARRSSLSVCLSHSIASAADGTLVAVSDFDVFVSRNRAESWTPGASLPIRCLVRSLAADPIDARRWYAGAGSHDHPCGQVVRTEDGGATWTIASELSVPVDHLVVDGRHPGVLYAVAGGRVLASADFGATWRDLGLPVASGAHSLALEEDGNRLHAATHGGVYELSFRRTTSVPAR